MDNNQKHGLQGTMGTVDAMERLAKVNAADYGMDITERITAQMVQVYLGKMPDSTATELLQGIMKDTVINIPALDDEAGLQRTEVEGRQLSALIDTALGDFRDILHEQILLAESDEAASVLKAVADGLDAVNGKLTVQNISPEFLTFIGDCYKVLR